jgi:phosphoglycolate phosphatase-like HAD superfamily hydrolase
MSLHPAAADLSRVVSTRTPQPAHAQVAAPSGEKVAAAARGGGRLRLPRVLLCDLDGTLIDSMPVLADLATEVMGEIFGTPSALARELYIATCGLPFVRQLEAVFPGDPRNAEASDRFEARKPERCDRIRMAEEVVRTLGEVKARGVSIVVSSNNGNRNVEAFAASADFSFDLVLGFGDGMGKGRPHIERAEAVFGVDRSEMLFVGDSLHDGEIAEREGLDFVGLAGTFSRERFALRFPESPVIRRFAEIPRLFEGSRSIQRPASDPAGSRKGGGLPGEPTSVVSVPTR